jgi:sensor histidine kinase YesM
LLRRQVNPEMTFVEYLRSRGKLVLWLIAVGILMTYFVCDNCHYSTYRYALVTGLTASLWITMWLGNEYLVMWLDSKIKWTTEPIKRLITGFLTMILYTLGSLSLLLKFFEWVLDLQINTKTETVYWTIGSTFFITLFMTSRSFLFNWRQSAIDAEKLQKENIAARYESLKSQVNPHFLFNNFNALTNLIYEDQDKAVKFIKQLSEVYRYVLDTRDREVVSVAEEIKFLESYIYLQKIRFGDKLNINVAVNNTAFRIAPLALQILLENAIKHNVVSEEDPLHVRIYSDGDYISVENNLQKKATIGEASMGIGLENICKRYEFLSDKKVEIVHDSKRFLVRLPLCAPEI